MNSNLKMSLSSSDGTNLTIEELEKTLYLFKKCQKRIREIKAGTYSNLPPIPFDGTTCPKLTTLTHEILTISKKLHEELLPIKFFEVELDDNPRSKELDNTDELVGQVSVCVLGRRKPSFEEAEKFCSPALEATDLPYVIAVREIDAETAATYLDMNHLNAYPVFE